MSIEIFDRKNSWRIEIKNEKWKFDDLQTMIKIVEKLENNLMFEVDYCAGFNNSTRTVYISVNHIINVKTRKELNNILKILLDTKMYYGRWKSCQ